VIRRWKTAPMDSSIPPSPTVASAPPSIPLPPPPSALPDAPRPGGSAGSSKPAVNGSSDKGAPRPKITKVKSSTVLLTPSVPTAKVDSLPNSPSLSGLRRSSKTAQPDSVRLLVEKIDSLAASQKILFQNSAAYAAKLESLEFVNKSMFLKIDQMMDTIEDSFKVWIRHEEHQQHTFN